MRVFLIVAVFLLTAFSAFSQNILDTRLNGSEKGKNLDSFLREFELSHEVQFYFMDEWINNIVFEEGFEGKTLSSALYDLFLGTDLNYVQPSPYIIVIVKDPSQALQRNMMLDAAKRERKKIEKMVIGSATAKVAAGTKVALTGKVMDGKTNDPLVGASVYASNIQEGTVTDLDGNYSLKLPTGNHVINFSYINFEQKVIDLEIYANGEVNLTLEEIPTVLEEIVVRDRSAREITTSSIGLTQLSMKEIKRAPALLGEVDLIKQIQVLPGVSTAGEAASGFNVRGGSVDQNLILYDGLPVFNSSHVFGFFSSFNTEAIRDVKFYRGGIPAEFGGRVSSVLDIRSREGSYEKWEATGGIGMISSNLTVGGPIKKDKTSVSASIRTTYSDWLINSIRSNYVNLSNSAVTFYDGAFKLGHRFSDKTKLTMSGYVSHDQFRLSGDSTYNWDSKLSSLRLDHEFSKNITSAFMVGYGSYTYNVFDKDPLSGFNLNYRINYPTAKADINFQVGTHKFQFGAQSIYYDFSPGTLTPSSSLSDKAYLKMEKLKSLETGIYLSDQFDLGSRLHADLGVRLTLFQSLGPGNVNIYKDGVSRETINLIDTLRFQKGENIKTFNNFEPRVSLRFDLTEQSSLKLGFNRIFQYLHLITNTTAVTPVDIWQPSGYYFKPQVGDQLSLGYYRTFKARGYEAFAEAYYKETKNVLDFKDGAQLLLNPQIETDLLQGNARGYGAETQITKSSGRLIGSLGYTFARSFRTIIGPFPEETINGGREYRSNFDQPHVLNMSWKYNISRRYFFTGAFTYHTGRPITLPVSAFSVDNITVSSFSDRNEFRIPDYHRLDLGVVMEGNHKRKKFWDGTWTFSLYNVYGRKNPYSIFFKEVRPGILRPYRLAIVGTIIPSLSYSFKI